MNRLPLAALGLIAVALPAAAQPMGQPPPTALRSFGVDQDGFYRSAAGRWADQLARDLADARADLRNAPVGPMVREATSSRADRIADAARELSRAARRGADRAELARRFEAVEAAANALTELVARDRGLAGVFTRATYTYNQLAAAVGEGDADPGRGQRAIVRLAEALEGEADDLWDTADRHLGGAFGRDLDRSVRRVARSARKLARELEESGDLAAAGRNFTAVSANWTEAVGLLGRVPNMPAQVRAEATRADGLYRRLAARLGAAAPQPPAPPPGPGPVIAPPALAPAAGVLAVAAGEGGGPRVQVFHGLNPRPAFDIFAYDEAFRGGVRVAVADMNGDGTPDLVTGPGKGMAPLVRVFDGRDMGLLAEFAGADPRWTGGVWVATADRTADGRSLVAVAPDAGGGPVVKVFDLAQGKEVASFLAYPGGFRGGVRLAWCDLNGDGRPEVVTAPGPGEVSLVRVWNPDDARRPVTEFRAFDPDWRGGVWAAGLGGQVVCGADGGGIPGVRVFEPARNPAPAAEWLAYPGMFQGGVRVALADLDGDRVPDVACAPGRGLPGSPVRVFGGRTRKDILAVEPFPGFDAGAFIAGR